MKDRIKNWLDEFSHSREWLAQQVDVKKRTVDNWLSSPQEIPSSKVKLIEKLIEADETAAALRKQQLAPPNQLFSVEIDLETFRAYSAAALAAGLTLEQWAIAQLDAAAAEYRAAKNAAESAPFRVVKIFGNPPLPETPNAAEEPPPN